VLAAPMHLAPRLAAAFMDSRGYQIAVRDGRQREIYRRNEPKAWLNVMPVS